MKIVNSGSAMAHKVHIDFPRLESWNPVTNVATMAATVNKKRVLCRISLELLQGKFHATVNNPIGAIRENRQLIEAVVTKLILRNAYEEDGSILIRINDV